MNWNGLRWLDNCGGAGRLQRPVGGPATGRRRFARPVQLLISVAVACGLLPLTPASQAQDDPPGPEYVVQSGDTLYSIALAFGTTVEALQTENAIADPTLLAIGQRLVVPGFGGVSGTLTTHRLAPGDTLISLAYRFGVDVETLIRLNHTVNPTALYVGEQIIYPVPADGGAAGYQTGRFIVTRQKDTLPGLAVRYNQSPWTVAQLNALPTLAHLFPAQRLFVPDEVTPLTGLPDPLVSLQLLPERARQGEPLGVHVQLNSPATLAGSLADWELQFAADGDSQVAFQGVDAFIEPGVYPLTVTAALPSGEVSSFELRLPIAAVDYGLQALVLPADTLALLEDPLVAQAEAARIAAAITPFTPTRYWTAAFTKPIVSDRITTAFGLRRSYNGGPFDSFHGGIDYGLEFNSPPSAPILAPAAGVVVLAEPLQIRGNATVIDHGWGVYTGYWHQAEILVAAGQQVAPGEQIGVVGSTGLSSGTHLHWELWVGGVQVNPLAWMALAYP